MCMCDCKRKLLCKAPQTRNNNMLVICKYDVGRWRTFWTFGRPVQHLDFSTMKPCFFNACSVGDCPASSGGEDRCCSKTRLYLWALILFFQMWDLKLELRAVSTLVYLHPGVRYLIWSEELVLKPLGIHIQSVGTFQDYHRWALCCQYGQNTWKKRKSFFSMSE